MEFALFFALGVVFLTVILLVSETVWNHLVWEKEKRDEYLARKYGCTVRDIWDTAHQVSDIAELTASYDPPEWFVSFMVCDRCELGWTQVHPGAERLLCPHCGMSCQVPPSDVYSET